MSDKKRILIVDDEENLRHMLSVMLKRQGYDVSAVSGGEEALSAAQERSFDFILCDVRMPGMDGRQFLRKASENRVHSTVIMMSAYGTVDLAVTCMKEGAYDFISKPFKKDEIIMVLRKAEERERLKSENISLKQRVESGEQFRGIIGRNPALLSIISQVRKLSGMRTTVLITGESGTGKELVARALHSEGDRAGYPFVAINCGAIPEHLLEGELFGHTRGSFTDALSDREGLLQQADKGTLFLDEIGEMPTQLQVKLLRFLQDGEVRKLGSARSERIDVRIVSATSRDLAADAASGRFREDLLFRLNVYSLHLPPLRDRCEDIPILAGHFLEKAAERTGLGVSGISQSAMRSLIAHTWPGNVRELENAMERALILADGGEILSGHLEFLSSGTEKGITGEESLSIRKAEEALERELIVKALRHTEGNRTKAAAVLEISLRSLLYKIKEYGLE